MKKRKRNPTLRVKMQQWCLASAPPVARKKLTPVTALHGSTLTVPERFVG